MRGAKNDRTRNLADEIYHGADYLAVIRVPARAGVGESER